LLQATIVIRKSRHNIFFYKRYYVLEKIALVYSGSYKLERADALVYYLYWF
jgi:hypothetical protein